MKEKIFEVMQRVGRSFMLPIALLPVVGILLGLGSSLTSATETYHLSGVLGKESILYHLLIVMKIVGQTIFDDLPIIFAIGVAIGMAKREKEVAAISAGIAYMVMNASVSACLLLHGDILADGSVSDHMLSGMVTDSMGIQTLQMGVFGGIIVGLGVARLHNRFYRIQLPEILSFFSGRRFVPMISVFCYLFVGILMFYIWPLVQRGLYLTGNLLADSGYLGTLCFGVIKRSLIPFGLHHVFYFPFWQTALGGSMEIGGKLVEGAQNIFFAQLSDPTTKHFSVEACRYYSGEFIFMIFGLPGAALAMYQTARPEKKKIVGGLLFSATLACMLTGITEPLEFSFLFVAPVLFAIQVILAGSAYMVAHILNIAVGVTFSGGLIDFVLLGVLQGNEKTNWLLVLPAGVVYFLLYYAIFRHLIVRLDLKTPGREEEDLEPILYRRDDFIKKQQKSLDFSKIKEYEQSAMITLGLGGGDNILDLDCCATRLRCSLKDKNLIDFLMLKKSGSCGIQQIGNGVQIIYGPNVSNVKSNLEIFLETNEAHRIEDFRDILTDLFFENEFLIVEEEREPEQVDDRPEDCVDILWKKPKTEHLEDQIPPVEKSDGEDTCRWMGAIEQRTVAEHTKGNRKDDIIYSPMNGKLLPLSDLSDLIFSSEILGKGVAIDPTDGVLYAPVDGEIFALYETKHAIGIRSETGVELLLHMGLNTVKLRGDGFKIDVEKGKKVSRGDRLASFDLEYIRKQGYDTFTPMIVSNTDCYKSVEVVGEGEVSAGDALLCIF